MTAALTPARALAYLSELSLDVRAAVVLDPEGAVAAGDAALGVRARALLETAEGTHARDGALLLSRTSDGGAIALLAGDFALMPLLEHDLAATAAALLSGRADPPRGSDLPS